MRSAWPMQRRSPRSSSERASKPSSRAHPDRESGIAAFAAAASARPWASRPATRRTRLMEPMPPRPPFGRADAAASSADAADAGCHRGAPSPFARRDELVVRFDAAGSAGKPPSLDGPRLTRDVVVQGRFIGRLVGEGPAVRQRAVTAALEAVALAIERIAPPRKGPTALWRLAMPRAASLPSWPSAGSSSAASSRWSRPKSPATTSRAITNRRARSAATSSSSSGFDVAAAAGVVIADVTGKGIAAALLMAFARPVIHTALQAARAPPTRSGAPTGSSSTSCTPPCSSPRWWVGWTSPADGSPSPVPVTNRRC